MYIYVYIYIYIYLALPLVSKVRDNHLFPYGSWNAQVQQYVHDTQQVQGLAHELFAVVVIQRAVHGVLNEVPFLQLVQKLQVVLQVTVNAVEEAVEPLDYLRVVFLELLVDVVAFRFFVNEIVEFRGVLQVHEVHHDALFQVPWKGWNEWRKGVHINGVKEEQRRQKERKEGQKEGKTPYTITKKTKEEGRKRGEGACTSASPCPCKSASPETRAECSLTIGAARQ
jgi:hypothetical protein